MRILYDATPLLMRSAGVKHYHHTLLRTLIPQIDPHQIGLFPFLDTLTANRPDLSNYPPYPTMWRLGAVLGSNYTGWNLAEPGCPKIATVSCHAACLATPVQQVLNIHRS